MRHSLQVGLDALRANPLRTVLSTLGVVMGVGAMVSVLSLGDGVERYAREQISRTTDLLAVAVTPRAMTEVDGQFIARDSVLRLRLDDVATLRAALPPVTDVSLSARGGAIVLIGAEARPRGLELQGIATAGRDSLPALATGQWFADTDTAVIVLSARAAGVFGGDSLRPEQALGASVVLRGAVHRVVGVRVRDTLETGLVGYVPVEDAWRAMGPRASAQLVIVAPRIEDVDSVRAATERWAAARVGPRWKDELQVVNRRDRAEQAATAMRVFKLLMAAITGVSLLVGGVGIMNVLLASVAERTREIGIRKAAGARDRDILTQFLAESVAITSAGAFVGVLLGLAVGYGTAWIMRMETGAPVQAAVTLPTVGFAVVISVVIGLVFGLYPARRAAKLSPIEAIRHES